jgi:hypothetical protein
MLSPALASAGNELGTAQPQLVIIFFKILILDLNFLSLFCPHFHNAIETPKHKLQVWNFPRSMHL